MLAHWKDESPSKDALFEIISKNLNLAFAMKYQAPRNCSFFPIFKTHNKVPVLSTSTSIIST